MSAPLDVDLMYAAEIRQPTEIPSKNEKTQHTIAAESDGASQGEGQIEVLPEPTEEELRTLRRVSGKMPWQALTITLVEFAERFSYYGTTAVFVNFIQQPLPYGSTTGNWQPNQACYDLYSAKKCEQPGALGQGQRTSTALITFNQFWAYLMPLLGGYIADTYLGRYMTIQISIAAAIIGHIILVISSIPSVISHPESALGCFAVGLVIMGLGTGGFKSNISPLMAEQVRDKRMRVITLESGERVIRDPSVVYSRLFLYFYMMINIGSLIGGIAMVYAERYIGFWLAYALPTFIFFLAPLVLISCKKKYVLSPPTGSVLPRAFKLLGLATKGRWSLNPVALKRNFGRGDFWTAVKPSVLGASAPAWMAEIDDAWVEQVARGFDACKVLFWMPLYWLAYNQITGNLTSMSAVLELNGVPNDLINNLNPLSLVIFIPLFDFVVYPFLRRNHIQFTPIKRIACGFIIAAMAMLSAVGIQYYIYKLSPCPAEDVSTVDGCSAPINVWVQTLPYCLIGFSEIFASISSLEYAYSKAPENMRGLVMGVQLLQNAFSSALGQALVPLSNDPLLVWNYAVAAILAFVGGVGFWFTWKGLDAREDELNMIDATTYKGRAPADRAASVSEKPIAPVV